LFVQLDAGQSRIEEADEFDVGLFRLRLKEREHPVHHLVQTARRQFQIAEAGELEEVAEQVFQAGTLFLDRFDLGQRAAFVGRLGAGEILRQQFHVHADDGQRVLDLVRQRARQLGKLVVLNAKSLRDFFRLGTWFQHFKHSNPTPRRGPRRNASGPRR